MHEDWILAFGLFIGVLLGWIGAMVLIILF